jgi:hypothetical protein
MPLQFLGSSIVPFSFLMRFRVASSPASSCLACYASPGCPVRCMRWPRRRRSCELPRGFSPFTVPVMDFRVAPNLASFCAAGLSESAGCPGSSRLRAALPDTGFGLPLVPYLPALPVMKYRVAPILASFGGADWLSFELPRRSVLRYRRRSFAQVAPRSRSSGTDWITSRVASGRIPSGCASGKSTSLPASSYPLATPVE